MNDHRLSQHFLILSGTLVFTWPSSQLHRDHATFLRGQITVCLGLEYLCVAAGGLCSVPGRDQRGPTWKYFCSVKGPCYWTWVTTSICKQKTLSVMREMLASQEQRKCSLSFPLSITLSDGWFVQDKNKTQRCYFFHNFISFNSFISER